MRVVRGERTGEARKRLGKKMSRDDLGIEAALGPCPGQGRDRILTAVAE